MNPERVRGWVSIVIGVNTLMTPSPPECQEKTTVIRIPAFGSVAGVAIYLDWLQGVLRYNLQCLSPIK